jgi:hypothetical protein
MALRMTAAASAHIVDRNAQALTVLTVTLGGVITLSSRARWGSPVWHDALRVPNAPATWGAILLIAGLLLLVGGWLEDHGRDCARAVQREGFRLAWIWATCLAVMQFSSFIHDTSGTANAIGLIVWCYVSYLYRLRFNGTDRRNYE